MEKKLERIFSAYHYVGGYELFFKTGAFTEYLFERYESGKPDWYGEAFEILKLLKEAGTCDPEKYTRIAADLEKIRTDIETQMREAVELRDSLSVCGYVLCRLCEPEPVVCADNDKEAFSIISLIFRSTDSVTVREGVKAAVASLPLRIAKSKFFDIVEGALESQLGRTEKEIDDIVSNIEGFGGLKISEGDVWDADGADVVETVFGSDLSDASAEELQSLYDRCDEASMRNGLRIDALSDMGLMINAALLELAASKHIGKGQGEVFANAAVTSFINKMIDAFESGDSKTFENGLLYEGIDESELEKLEDIRIKIPGYEDTFLQMAKSESEDVYEDARRCVALISDSIFGDLSESEPGKTVDRDMIMQKAKELNEKLMQAFASGSKLLQRARMAGILSKLPLFLNNSDEVKDYIRNSLESCRDEREKAAAIREFKNFFADI